MNISISYVMNASELFYTPLEKSNSIMDIDGTQTIVNQIKTALSFDGKMC